MSAKDLLIQLFGLPKGEIIFQDYSCALKGLISKYGRVFIAENHICFYANLAGSKTNLVIKLDDVSKLDSKNKSDIDITLKDGRTFCFNGFHDKDQVYNLMNALISGQPLSNQQTMQTTTDSARDDDSQIENAEVEIQFLQQGASMDQEMCKFTFSFNLDKFFEFFFADDALVYSIADHRQSEKDTDIQLTKWTPMEDNPAMFQREMKNVIKLTGVPFKDKSRMHKLFTYKKEADKLIYTCTTHTLDVPYGNSFQAEEKWEVSQLEDNKCLLKIFASVVFTKSTMMKGTIMSKTMSGLKEDYEKWINNVKIRLEAMAKSQKSQTSNINHEFEDSKKLDDNILNKIMQTNQSQQQKQNTSQSQLYQGRKSELLYLLSIFLLIIIMLIQIGILNKQSQKLENLELLVLKLQQR
ncbi:unnamed protein product [Paramecium octaurelia]|uniref:VASt domain-containing protein n=1 Tax=Paramecium octaurelia TaxID=43137 RepID=A0A8S1T5Q5_PAROT|nr:unnamed protein product [Paramecium octaurelia]